MRYLLISQLHLLIGACSQKTDKSRHLCWPARVASTWILSQLREKRVVKGQAYQETLQQSGSWKKRDPVSYSYIRDV